METAEIRRRYLEFFKKKGHAIIPSASLVPENDPTTLFTGSGMQPLVPYLLGATHPEGKRITNSQKCFRAEDIDEVGDNRHTTFFEMLGNWSFGDYWKQEQLPWFFEFLTKEVGLKPENLYVTVFSGGEGIDRDSESIAIWEKLFAERNLEAKYAAMETEEQGSERGMKPGERIFGYGVKKNWWSRAGVPSKMPAGEPGGPDSEVFYDFDPTGKMHDSKFGAHCHPNCDCGRFLEIGNSVFMEYRKKEDGDFEKLPKWNVDFGGGLERITAAANGDADIFKIDVFAQITKKIEEFTGKKYDDNKKPFRIVADHLRAALFLIGDGVVPGNKDKNYFVRRLLRRAVFYLHLLKPDIATASLVYVLADAYQDQYPELKKNLKEIDREITTEETKFVATLARGMREFEKIIEKGSITGEDAFVLFTTYGFPFELTLELATQHDLRVDEKGFAVKMKEHQDLSRTASAGTFKGGLADHSEETTRLHTTHHLLLKALQIVLGPQVKQRGSNITSERLRMDFSYDGKMTEEQKREAERIVNEKIAEDLPVIRSEMAREDAEKLGAEHEFGQKYPERVSVYSVGPKSATQEDPQFEKAFSIEFCGGPHVTHTGAIGKFKIMKEEAVGAGIRRIRGVLD